ncbi:MAG: glutamine synthetase family protein [Clostridiales bacterium]|nr:glutamine synthetase family protein [Clostridiales bacterium]
MKYTKQEVMQFVKEEDVKFIRLTFCDVFGKSKNVSIMDHELSRAFEHGIAMDAWSIAGFDSQVHSDLFLHPDPSTLEILPWRPEHGRVVRMFCDITWPNGAVFECDTRHILKKAIKTAAEKGIQFQFGSEMEFYLFERDESGNPTKTPYDHAGYMDISPEDRGENIRREICLTLEQMGIYPESSHHEEGPGQNEIDFRYSDPLSAADNAITFISAVKTIANHNGIFASFDPKPLEHAPGNGMHINFSIKGNEDDTLLHCCIAGVLKYIPDVTLYLNRTEASYQRLGSNKAPGFITWSAENRSQLIRIPAAVGSYRRAELRSADPMTNPYLAYTLLIYAGLYGIEHKLKLPPAADMNLYTAPKEILEQFAHLPKTLAEAKAIAKNSTFIQSILPTHIMNAYDNSR